MQVNFLPYGQPGDLWVRSKGRISLNFNYKINFEDFRTKLCVFSQIRFNTYQTDLSLCRLGHAPGVGL